MENGSRRTQGGRAAAALVAGVAVASCIRAGGVEPTPVGETRSGARRAAPPSGDYACSLQAGAHRYPAFRCHIYRAEDGSLVLEKAGGSQRFRGRVTPSAGGFAFEGTFFCPSGDCTENVTAEFAAVGPAAQAGKAPAAARTAAYRGILRGRSGPLGVSLEHLPGGFTYGGATAAAGGGVTGAALSR